MENQEKSAVRARGDFDASEFEKRLCAVVAAAQSRSIDGNLELITAKEHIRDLVLESHTPGIPEKPVEPMFGGCPSSHNSGFNYMDSKVWRLDTWVPGKLVVVYSNSATGEERKQDQWPRAFGIPPRTCSFCGGIHPRDAINLVQCGWIPAQTDKPSKFYLHHPGWGTVRSAHHDPVPCVKVYLRHFTQEQVNLFLETTFLNKL